MLPCTLHPQPATSALLELGLNPLDLLGGLGGGSPDDLPPPMSDTADDTSGSGSAAETSPADGLAAGDLEVAGSEITTVTASLENEIDGIDVVSTAADAVAAAAAGRRRAARRP